MLLKNKMEHGKIKSLEWNKEYLLHNQLLDDQHKKFVTLINKLSDAINKDCKHEIHDVFFEIIYYIEHYMIEKDMNLINCDKSKYVKHRALHSQLLDKVKLCYLHFNDSQTLECCKELHTFLRNWFVAYIKMLKRDNFNECWNP